MFYCDIDLVFEPLGRLLNAYRNTNTILVDDFNEKSTIWWHRPTDLRGQSLIALTSNANLEIVNDANSILFFCRPQGEDWINILLVWFYTSCITDWMISHAESISHHWVRSWTYQGRLAVRLPVGDNYLCPPPGIWSGTRPRRSRDRRSNIVWNRVSWDGSWKPDVDFDSIL